MWGASLTNGPNLDLSTRTQKYWRIDWTAYAAAAISPSMMWFRLCLSSHRCLFEKKTTIYGSYYQV